MDNSEEKNRSHHTSLLTKEMTASSEISKENLTEIENQMEVKRYKYAIILYNLIKKFRTHDPYF